MAPLLNVRLCYQSFVDTSLAASYLNRLEAYLNSVAKQSTIDIRTMTPADTFAHPVMEFRCARNAVRNAIGAQREGYDGFVIGHMQDSGLWESKAAVDIPVTGLGEISMLYACTLGMRIGIVTINPRFIPGFQRQVRHYGLEHRVTAIHAMTFEPGELTAAFDSDSTYRNALASFETQAAPLVAAGVEVLIPGGGIPMLLFERERGFNVAGAPVVNGIPLLVRMSEMAVEMKQVHGLGLSRSSDMVIPPEYVLEELLGP